MGVNPTPGVGANPTLAELRSKLPADLIQKMDAEPDKASSIMDAYLKENRRTLDDDVYDNIVNFQKAEADEAAQKARAEAHDQAVKDMEQQKAEAAKLRETNEYQAQGITVTDYGNAEAARQTQVIELTAPTEKQGYKKADGTVVDIHKAGGADRRRQLGAIREDIKETASYTTARKGKVYLEKQEDGTFKETKTVVAGKTYKDEASGKEVSGKDMLDTIRKSAEKEAKDLKKQIDALNKELKTLGLTGEDKKKRDKIHAQQAVLAAQRDIATQEAVEANRAFKTAKGNGTRAVARGIRKSIKRDNDVAERQMVVLNDNAAKELRQSQGLDKDAVGVLSKDDLNALEALQALAQSKIDAAKDAPSSVKVDVESKWGALSRIQIPTGNETPEQIEEMTRLNQTALRQLSGFDNTIDPTEKKTIIDELGSSVYSGVTRGDLNHLYKTYGMHYTTRFEFSH